MSDSGERDGNDDRPAGRGETLWHGRFETAPADELMAFTASLAFDRRLATDDIRGSRAHVSMLCSVGILSTAERDEILAALDTVESELEAGEFSFVDGDEDIHTAVERRVSELVPASGPKIHTGRSRNDQVATDLRLFVRRAGRDQLERLVSFQEVLVERALEVGDAALPGYTHLQRAQPVLLAHHLLAHFWAFQRDAQRWLDCLDRVDVSPLGAGALAGSTLPIDPRVTASELGFTRVFENSLDAVSDRDFVAEALFVCSMVATHCSRIGEEIVVWSSEEFGFCSLADEFATGSSMMPQKKNPDVAELARAKAGRVLGDLTGMLATLKGLPLAYNRDLQEDKEPLFDALDACALTLSALSGLLSTLEFDLARMAAAADDPAPLATDLAEWLVMRGVPFRRTHEIVGALVRRSLEDGVALRDAVEADEVLGPEAAALLEPGSGVARRRSPGASGPEPVARQIEAARAALTAQRATVAALRH